MRLGRFCLTQTYPHIYASFLQQRRAAPMHARIGVDTSDETACNTGLYEGIGAGRGLSVMAAGFERNVSCCASRLGASDLERHSFSMGAAAILGRAFPDNVSVLHEDAAHGGIFRRPARLLRA